MQSGLTNIVTRTLPAGRTSPWQQYYVSSDPRTAQAWSPDGLELSWSGTGVAGSATASPAGDSMRLALSSNLVESLTFLIAPTRTSGLLRSPKPLYLVRWTPQPAFSPGPSVAAVTASNGTRYVAAILAAGGAAALPFTLDPGLRPQRAAPGQEELGELALPPDPSSDACPVFTAGLTAGYLTAAAPAEASLPAYGTSTAVRVLLYRPVVTHGGWIEPDRPLGQFGKPYPLDTHGLRSKWRANAAANGEPGMNGFSVSSGLGTGTLRPSIDGEFTDWHEWEGGETSALAAYAIVGTSTNIWDETAEREPDNDDDEDDDSDGGGEEGWDDGEDEDGCDDCESGDCGEGPEMGSLKFRIPLGSAGRGRISGFLWFALETPVAVTRDLFSVLGDAAVFSETNAAALTVACAAERGRTVAVSNVTHGVTVWVSGAEGVLEHSWEITNPGGDTNSMRFVKRGQGGARLRDETFAYSAVEINRGLWTRSDNLCGVQETVDISGDLRSDSSRTDDRTLGDIQKPLSKIITRAERVGEGEAAAARETLRQTWDGANGAYLSRLSAYWTDNVDTRRNGRLKLGYGGGEGWVYRAYDGRGRRILAAGPLDGSSWHADMLSRDDIDSVSGLAALQGLSCKAKAYSYEPLPQTGDTADHNDSRSPRTVTAYAVSGGAAVPVSREWRVYGRVPTNGLQALCVRTERAASAAAQYGDPGNAVSESVTCAGPESTNAPALWNLPLSETSEDGTLRTWEYERGNYNPATGAFAADSSGTHLRVTSRTGTLALPQGAEDFSTYEVEIRDASFGQTLRRETRLHGNGDPLLSWTEGAYDVKGRLLTAAHSDGTSESNVWDCCGLMAAVGRDGRRTDTVTVPEQPNFSVSVESSLALLPGAGGICPAVETYTDPLGRVTNSVRRAYTYPGLQPANDPAYPDLATATEYPEGTGSHRVTTDASGASADYRRTYGGNTVTDTDASAGVTNSTTRTFGGASATLTRRTDPVSGIAQSLEKRTESSWDSAGLETVTVSARSGGGAWTAESATRKDFLGRAVTVATPGFGGATLAASNAYDNAGRTLVSVDRDGSRIVYAYTALGNVAGTVRIGAGQTVQFDPQSFTLAGVVALDAYIVTETPAWKESGDLGLSAWGVPQAWWECGAVVSYLPGQSAVTTAVTRTQLTGLSAACVRRTVTADADGASTITTEAVDSGSAKTTAMSVNTALSSAAITESVAGAQTFSTNTMGGATSYLFDGLARQVAAVETAGGRTLQRTTGYHGDGTLAFTAEVSGPVSNVTAYGERQYLQTPAGAYTVTSTDALGNGTVSYYTADGNMYRTGGAVYPTATATDANGRQSELRTWRDGNGDPDITRWRYDEVTGLLTNKVYADGKGPAYAYTADGRLESRTWARGVTATYAYADNADGSVQSVGYSDATPGVTNRYDLAGRLTGVQDGAGSRTLTYDARGRLTAETNTLAVITRRYDSMGRDAGFDLDLPGFATNTFGVRYGYDGNGRMDTVTSGMGGLSNTFAFSFLPCTSFVTGMTNSLGGGWTRSYEPNRNLISAVSNFWGGSQVSAFAYENDALGRRTLRVDSAPALSATNAFAYNHRSEVTNAEMSAASYSYAYDDIGNRKWALSNAVACTYSANQLNQYYGVTNAGAWLPVMHDADGNMTRLGGKYYSWDAENSMRRISPLATSNGNVRVDSAYDYMNRRVSKAVTVLTGYIPFTGIGQPYSPGEWVPSNTTYFVWDGWNVAAEIRIDYGEGTTNVHCYTWGLDLSGSIQGAGGVGGLLADTVIASDSPQPVTYYPAFDANGNVTEYVDATGTVRGRFEYSAFGEIKAESGDLASTFTHRFSTKPFDAETGVSKFQQRDYVPPLGRWASRDPIEERGGVLLYAYVNNSAVYRWDLLGQWPWEGCCGSKTYNRFTKCCCCEGSVQTNSKKGNIYRKKAIKTGIRSCEISSFASSRNGGSGWPHAWLEVDDFSAGFGPGTDGNGDIKIPDKRKGGECEEIELDPCKYDIKKVKQAIIQYSQAAQLYPPKYTPPWYWCYTWRDDIIKWGKEIGKGHCGK